DSISSPSALGGSPWLERDLVVAHAAGRRELLGRARRGRGARHAASVGAVRRRARARAAAAALPLRPAAGARGVEPAPAALGVAVLVHRGGLVVALREPLVRVGEHVQKLGLAVREALALAVHRSEAARVPWVLAAGTTGGVRSGHHG